LYDKIDGGAYALAIRLEKELEKELDLLVKSKGSNRNTRLSIRN
jgi:hypothetical protein